MPLTGFTTMLKRIVPTPETKPVGPATWHRRIGRRVDREDVLVGQRELDRGVPVAAELVEPVRAVELDDEADLGPVVCWKLRVRRRETARRRAAVVRTGGVGTAVRDEPSVTVVVRLPEWKTGGVDPAAVGADREGARRVAEERHDRQRACRRGAAPRLVASKTQTSARPMPGVLRTVGIVGDTACSGRDARW